MKLSTTLDLVGTVLIGGFIFAACADEETASPTNSSDLTQEPVEVPRAGILDRQGRPEISNFVIRNKNRTAYNAQDTFALEPEARADFEDQLQAGLEMWDAMDGYNDWTPEGGAHPLIPILIEDVLIVDMSKPVDFGVSSYLDIEMAAMRGEEHTTCGGRHPDDDVVDVLQTLYVNNYLAETVSDGVDAPTKWATKTFPYLASRNSLFSIWGGFWQ